MSALLEVQDLSAGYGKIRALRCFSLKLERGAAITVIGRNGAGKSTMVNALAGLLRSRGTIRLNGQRIDHLPTEARLELGMALVPERRELFGSMSVEENLLLGAYSRRRNGARALRASLEKVFQRFPKLKDRRRQIATTLSGGERQMLAIGRALMADPVLMLLDEPSLGLAPKLIADVFDIVVGLREAGISILLIEQNARMALQVTQDACVLENGEVVLRGPSAELIADPRLMQSYLGEGPGDPIGVKGAD